MKILENFEQIIENIYLFSKLIWNNAVHVFPFSNIQNFQGSWGGGKRSSWGALLPAPPPAGYGPVARISLVVGANEEIMIRMSLNLIKWNGIWCLF